VGEEPPSRRSAATAARESRVVAAKKAPARYCEGRGLKAEFKKLPALNSATACQSQTLEFQATHLSRRFGLTATAARIVAQHAFSNGRA
jgi:hypothetical protein